MGFQMERGRFDEFLTQLREDNVIYAPKRFVGGGAFSDTDCVRYGEISAAEEIVWDEKSDYSFKEVLLPVSQTLFYFTEDQTKTPAAPKKGAVVFLRSCDLHAVRRLDAIYLRNGPADFYYSRVRSRIRFIVMGCARSFENCFCVSMGTNRPEGYAMSIEPQDGGFLLDCPDAAWAAALRDLGAAELPVVPRYVTENNVKVHILENLSAVVAKSSIWNEYSARCINCGRCNFVCPTCTCFTMQDLYYSDNANVGERRRVWASCMVDGFTDVAGGGSYRKTNGERMRFKVLHKVLDFRQRNGFQMCVGCGRCDDICPEYISFSHCLNKLDGAMKEVLE